MEISTVNPYTIVRTFETSLADYAGSKYAVAVDSCTWALFLCFRYLNVGEVCVPKHTFTSVPQQVIHAGGSVRFVDLDWTGLYQLKPYPIIDGACRFSSEMYNGGFHCLSFQYRKHLAIGKGGAILTDDLDAAQWFKLARNMGRPEEPNALPKFIGWHCYMEPDRAARGLHLLSMMPAVNADRVFDYPDQSIAEPYRMKVVA